MNKEFICLSCPIGCNLMVEINDKRQFVSVEGNGCSKGALYAKEEATSPKRMLTALIDVVGGSEKVTSVKTSVPIPKGMIFDVMEEIKRLQLQAPLQIGDVVIHNVRNTHADIIVTRNIK